MKSKNFFRILIICLLFLTGSVIFAGCSAEDFSIETIEYTRTEGEDSIYTVTYSNGKTSEFVIKDGRKAIDALNGKDGKDGQTPHIGSNGNWWIGETDTEIKAVGVDGQNGLNLTITDIYNKYVEECGEISYEDFLNLYFKDYKIENQTKVINECLLSSVKLYTQFKEGQFSNKNTAVYGGSGVIYKIEDEFTYIITNYHVVFDENANSDNGGNLPQKIVGYVYGSENTKNVTSDLDVDGYEIVDYGNYAIDLEYVGGSALHDIAIIRANTNEIKAINPQIKTITFAKDYHVGETAIAIGNILGNGISATTGIVSVDNEITSLNVDGTLRNYRSIRIETPIYHGSSGGGLFNAEGKLIGITNSGTETYENINYAVPVSVVKNIAENIMDYAYDGVDETVGAYKILIGCTVQGVNSKFVYDNETGYGVIKEEILITDLVPNSISTNDLELMVDDVIVSMIINGTEYQLNRNFEIGDLILTLRVGDTIKFGLNRNGSAIESNSYTILQTDLISVN